MLHQDGKVNKIPVVLTQKEPSSTFFLERENLKKGVNIITLFDGDKNPILERMFFNKKDMLDGEVTFNVSPMAKDSIRVAVRSNMPEAKISVSVLPSMTKSYNPKDNIRRMTRKVNANIRLQISSSDSMYRSRLMSFFRKNVSKGPLKPNDSKLIFPAT